MSKLMEKIAHMKKLKFLAQKLINKDIMFLQKALVRVASLLRLFRPFPSSPWVLSFKLRSEINR